VHPREHPDIDIDVIVNLHRLLVVVEPVEAAHVLLQRSLQRDWHRQKQRVETAIVKAFANVASGSKDHPRFGICNGSQLLAVSKRSGANRFLRSSISRPSVIAASRRRGLYTER